MTTDWISVKDRLPESANWVIVCNAMKRVYPGYYEHGEWWNDFEERDYQGATHWQPLPEPPEVTE